MKRFLLAALVVAVFVGLATPAQAYTRINANCILRAYTPNTGSLNGQFYGHGEIDCNSTTSLTLAACLQQLVSGLGWQNVTCDTWGPYTTTQFSGETYGVWPVAGRWYRTEDQGWVGGNYAQYWSSGVQG